MYGGFGGLAVGDAEAATTSTRVSDAIGVVIIDALQPQRFAASSPTRRPAPATRG
jgi:hypothetical protein